MVWQNCKLTTIEGVVVLAVEPLVADALAYSNLVIGGHGDEVQVEKLVKVGP